MPFFMAVTEASEAFEAALSVLAESAEQSFTASVEQHFRLSVMEMCECRCGELLEPMSYKQCATYVSVPLLLSAQGPQHATLSAQMAASVGPECPVANCRTRMQIQRYLMQPVPVVLTVALVWDSSSGSASDVAALLQRARRQQARQELAQVIGPQRDAKLAARVAHQLALHENLCEQRQHPPDDARARQLLDRRVQVGRVGARERGGEQHHLARDVARAALQVAASALQGPVQRHVAGGARDIERLERLQVHARVARRLSQHLGLRL